MGSGNSSSNQRTSSDCHPTSTSYCIPSSSFSCLHFFSLNKVFLYQSLRCLLIFLNSSGFTSSPSKMPLVWMEQKQNTSLSQDFSTSDNQDRHWKQETRVHLPEHDTNLGPTASKVLTHPCSPAHGSCRVSLCQLTLDKISSPPGLLNPPSK